MIAITELDVVNACLATLGELPLVELQDEHPLVAAARQNMRESIIAETHKQWWFNTDRLTLSSTEPEHFVYVPADAVAIQIDGRTDLAQRGRRLYDRMNSTYVIPGIFRGWIVRALPFDDLPVSAQLLVQHATVMRFQINYDADDSKTQKQDRLYTMQYRLVNAEHTRQIALNGLEVPNIAQKRMYAGVRPQRRGGIPVR